MRLIFYYVSHRAAPGEDLPFDWSADNEDCLDHYYAKRLDGEGYYHLLEKVSTLPYIDEVLIVIESKDNTGTAMMDDKIRLVVTPDVSYTHEMMKPGDVLWIRGGWKHWHDFVQEAQEKGHWALVYAANTGREKWPIWDVVLDDLKEELRVDETNRLIYEFRKPISERIFKHFKGTPVKYEIIIGASRIHDKKGQWRVINALIEHKRKTGVNLKSILPGPWARGGETNKIMAKIRNNNLAVETPGEVTRERMCEIMNQSKVFVHAGSHGQGDRGLMEAMACGCHIVMGFPSYHAKWISKEEQPFIKIPMNTNNPVSLLRTIQNSRAVFGKIDRKEIAEYYLNNSGLNCSFLRFKKLLDWFNKHPERLGRELFWEDLL